MAVPHTTCHFRKEFSVLAPHEATIAVAADDQYELYVNGRRVGSGGSITELDQYDITRFMTTGRNLVALRVANVEGSTAALAARVEVKDRAGHSVTFVTDDSWVTNLGPLPFWYTPVYNDARWDAAQAFGAVGATAPWDTAEPVAASAGPEEPSQSAAAAESDPAAAAQGPNPLPVAVQQPSPFHVDAQFDVQTLLGNDSTGSLVAMAFNEFGHVVAAREGGPLLLIYDSDDDQRPDTVRTYCEQVKDCQGIVCLNGYVLVTGDGPDGRGLYRLRDNDRDGRLENPEILLRLASTSSEFGPHGLTLGSDGYLYLVTGSRTQLPEGVDDHSPYRGAYQGDLLARQKATDDRSASDAPASDAPESDQSSSAAAEGDEDEAGNAAPAGTLLRIDTAGKQVQVLAGGLRNAYDLAFNQEGELFTFDGDAESELGAPWYRPPTLHHVVAGAEFGWRGGEAQWPAHFVDRLPGILDVGRAAPTGMVFYRHYIFPDDYHDSLFVADWSGGRILNVKLKVNGASYSANSEVFLEGDELGISDVDVGPDGGLYFVTGGRGTVGGLYRVAWKGKPPQSATELGTGLTAVIRQPQLDAAWSRQKIALTKAEMGADWDRLVRGVAMSAANPWQYRIRALNLMQLYGPEPGAPLLIQMSRVKNEQVRIKAAQLMGIHASNQTQQALVDLLRDSDRRVRRRACEALLSAGQSPPLESLIPLLKSDDRHEAWAARRLLERLPAEQWRSQLLADEDHRLLIQSSLALLVSQPNRQHARQVLQRLTTVMEGFVSDRDFTDMLRVTEIALLRGDVQPTDVPQLGQLMAAEFPSSDAVMNRHLVRLVAYLKPNGLLDRGLAQLASENISQQEKMHLALHLHHLPGQWQSEQRMQVLDFFQRAKSQESGAGYAARISAAEQEFAATISDQELNTALAVGARYPAAALSLLYRMPVKLDTETFNVLEALDRQILRTNEPDTLRLKIGIAAVMARSGDAASQAYLRGLWDLDPERRMAVAMGLAQWPSDENWHYLVRALSVLEGDAAREVLTKLRAIELAPEQPEFYRQVILRGLQLGGKGGAEAVALLEFWTGRKATPGQDPVAALATWQQWYAERWPDLPEASLPAYRVSGKWDYQALLKHLIVGDGRFGSPQSGAVVFEQAQCAKCHRLGSLGVDEAPDLTDVYRRAMKKEILESILFPSHILPVHHRTHTVLTKKGRMFSGRVDRPDDSQFLITLGDGRTVTLAATEVEEVLLEKASAMPEGLLDGLELSQVADLFALLRGPDQQVFAEKPQRTILR